MKRQRLALISILLLVALSSTNVPSAHLAAQTPNPAFHKVWERTDKPVLEGRLQRTWLWGPEPIATLKEPLAESPGGMREVQYYDKSRMEISNPTADPNSTWYVTNGLLVYEMVSGRVQVGANQYERREPARISVAGDTATDERKLRATPSYNALRNVATLTPGQHQAQPSLGKEVREKLTAAGAVEPLANEEVQSLHILPKFPTLTYYEATTGHNIPDVFWDFMNQRAIVHEQGQYREGKLFDWLYTMGYPITEPYWTYVQIEGDGVLVLMQAFQRRVLTYNPRNELRWQVEMGNVGSHYYSWRYGSLPGATEGAVSVPMREIMNGDLETPRPTYELFTNENAWTSFWYSYRQNPTLPPMPTIDFQHEIGLAAAWGPRNDTGYDVIIQAITLKDKTLTVKVRQWRTSGGVFFMVTYPAHVVAIPRSAFDGGTYTVLFLDTEGVLLNRMEMSLP